jgi:hypothetical protein
MQEQALLSSCEWFIHLKSATSSWLYRARKATGRMEAWFQPQNRQGSALVVTTSVLWLWLLRLFLVTVISRSDCMGWGQEGKAHLPPLFPISVIGASQGVSLFPCGFKDMCLPYNTLGQVCPCFLLWPDWTYQNGFLNGELHKVVAGRERSGVRPWSGTPSQFCNLGRVSWHLYPPFLSLN